MIKKVEASPEFCIRETVEQLSRDGLLLVSGRIGKANVMTIGWGLCGILWSKPFFMVAVRPSRYTFKLIEENGDFTVNVPRKGMEEIISYCGTVSGKEHDKFKEKGLTPLPSRFIKSPIIAECIINYECRVVYKTKLVSNNIPREIIATSYPKGDFHTLYFGEILATYVDEDFMDELQRSIPNRSLP